MSLPGNPFPYYAQLAEVVSCGIYEKGQKAVLVYKVKVDNGLIIPITEDCLMAVKDRL